MIRDLICENELSKNIVLMKNNKINYYNCLLITQIIFKTTFWTP